MTTPILDIHRTLLEDHLATKKGRTQIFEAVRKALVTRSGFLIRPEEYYKWDDNDLREKLTEIIWAHQDMIALKFKEITEEDFWVAVEEADTEDTAQAIHDMATSCDRNHPLLKKVTWNGLTLRERIVAAQKEWLKDKE